MKRNRRILLLLWILSLIGISFYGGPVTYGIFFLLTLIPAVSLCYCFLVILLFKIYQNVEGRSLVCSRPAVFNFSLQNESPVLFSGIRVIFYSSFSAISGLGDKTEYELFPHSGVKRRTNVVCRYRGDYEIGIKTIEVTDFFRLFTIAYRNREPLKVRVKPNIIHLTELNSYETAVSAVRNSNTDSSEADILMREYIPGDDPRLINWKASGSAGKLLVRQRIGEQQHGVGIFMDPQRPSARIEEYLPIENKILETVIALNLFLSEQGIPVENWIFGNAFESITVEQKGGFESFYDRMSAYLFGMDHSTEQLYEEVMRGGRIADKKAVFFVIHDWNDNNRKIADELSRNSIPVIVYVITDEEVPLNENLLRIRLVKIPTNADLTEVL